MIPNPARYQGIIDEPEPETLDILYTGMSAVGWNRSYIPNFAVLEHPIRAFVMSKLGAGKKSKQRAKRIKLSECAEWTPSLKQAYARMKRALVNAVKRAHRDPDMIACLIWDASKWAWSYTITQVAPEELAKPWHEQQHQMLVTRSGLFKGSQLAWHTGCKEAWPPHRALVRDYQFLAGKHPFIAAGDHRNITYIMCKKRRPQILRKTAHDRLDRMCLKWAHENFQIYTVPGVQNTFNDFHSRDGAPDGEPFYTLAEHAERILAKEQALEKLANGTDIEISETPQNANVQDTDTSNIPETSEGNQNSNTGGKTGSEKANDGTDEHVTADKSADDDRDANISAAASAAGDDSVTASNDTGACSRAAPSNHRANAYTIRHATKARVQHGGRITTAKPKTT